MHKKAPAKLWSLWGLTCDVQDQKIAFRIWSVLMRWGQNFSSSQVILRIGLNTFGEYETGRNSCRIQLRFNKIHITYMSVLIMYFPSLLVHEWIGNWLTFPFTLEFFCILKLLLFSHFLIFLTQWILFPWILHIIKESSYKFKLVSSVIVSIYLVFCQHLVQLAFSKRSRSSHIMFQHI